MPIDFFLWSFHTHPILNAIVGLSGAGKSTLLNRIIGVKVSIVSSKVQTTRTRVLGIALEDNSQLIFIDTPGIFLPKLTAQILSLG